MSAGGGSLDTTERDHRGARRGSGPGRSAYLVLAFDCEDPAAPPARHLLDKLQSLVVGRARERGAHLSEAGESLFVGAPDRWMSSAHARFSRVLERWVVEDLGSKNGVFVGGERTERAELSPGDLVELGHTFFLFDEAAADPLLGPVAGPDDRSGLATLQPELAIELRKLAALAPSPVPIVLRGETGTGKEVAARAVHRLSQRAGEFVAVNCGAIAPTLIESELFGYRRGAFSGAAEDRPGLVRAADGGTLFLDEIGDLPLPAQAALLRALQEGKILPVNGTHPIKIDVRLLAATHRDLEAMVVEEKFRADLLARVSGFTLRLPPLRERREDLGLLIAALLARHFPERRVRFTPDAARALFLHDWPLNARELEKCLLASVLLAGEAAVDVPHLPPEVTGGRPAAAPQLSPEDALRREQIVALLREHRGNLTAVARAMGKARMQLHRWVRRYAIEVDEFRR